MKAEEIAEKILNAQRKKGGRDLRGLIVDALKGQAENIRERAAVVADSLSKPTAEAIRAMAVYGERPKGVEVEPGDVVGGPVGPSSSPEKPKK